MALYLIATPIGNPKDISVHALEVLNRCETVIGEELKVCRRLLADHQVGMKELYQLNEHSNPEDVDELVKICLDSDVALVSDCGTPGFCDPGSMLVKALRQKRGKIFTLPGASSLMYLLSLSSQRIDSFYFKGFLPANKSLRDKDLGRLKSFPEPIILMETPYRLGSLIADLKKYFPNKKILIGVNLSKADELIWEGIASKLSENALPDKAEPIVLIY